MIKFKKKTTENNHREFFLKIKKKILKKYPSAKTMIDIFGKYYVVTGDGYRIIPDDCCLPNTKNVFDAWNITLMYIRANHQIQRNTCNFNKIDSDNNVMDRILKQS